MENCKKQALIIGALIVGTGSVLTNSSSSGSHTGPGDNVAGTLLKNQMFFPKFPFETNHCQDAPRCKTGDFAPVCSSDGKTHSNLCHLKFVIFSVVELRFRHEQTSIFTEPRNIPEINENGI